MLQDVIMEAIDQIEAHRAAVPEGNSDLGNHIDRAVEVLESLLDLHTGAVSDECFPIEPSSLDDEERENWRRTCEEQIAAWTDRLRLIGPALHEERSGKAAVYPGRHRDRSPRRPGGMLEIGRLSVFRKTLQNWNGEVTEAALDGIRFMIENVPEANEMLLGPLARLNYCATKEMAFAALGLGRRGQPISQEAEDRFGDEFYDYDWEYDDFASLVWAFDEADCRGTGEATAEEAGF